jgi:AraC-like DNA-binding protein
VQYYADKQGLSPRHFADIVKQVADELGFPEQFTFRKYFKSHTGQSPTEYQQAQKTDGVNIDK